MILFVWVCLVRCLSEPDEFVLTLRSVHDVFQGARVPSHTTRIHRELNLLKIKAGLENANVMLNKIL